MTDEDPDGPRTDVREDDAPSPPPKPKLTGRGGPGRGQGRKKGVPGRATIERELRKARAMAEQALQDAARARDAVAAVHAAKGAGQKLAKEVLEEFMMLFASMAAAHQPLPAGMPVPAGRSPDERKFKEYAVLARDTAKELAPFQSPRFSAVMVGESGPVQVEVVGGLPDLDRRGGGPVIDGDAPAQIEQGPPTAPAPAVAGPVPRG